MNLKNFILTFSIGVLFQLSCKEGSVERTCFTCGYVKEYFTQKPIPNAKVGIYEDYQFGQLVEEVYTDSNGMFKAKSDWRANHYYIFASASGYYNFTYSVGQTNYDEANKIFYLDQPGFVQVHAKNTKPFDTNDRIGMPDFWPYVEIYGSNIDTMLCCLVKPSYKVITVRAFVRKNFKDTTNHVKCIPLPLKTITVNLNY